MASNYEVKIALFVQDTRARVNAAARAERYQGALPDSRLDVILRKCGWERQTPQNRKRIKAALLDAGIFTDPDLETRQLAAHERIYFLTTPPKPEMRPRWTFASERGLEEFLETHWGSLPGVLAGVKIDNRQYRLDSGGVIDLLGWNARSRELVIIELKKDDPPEGLFLQLMRYLDELDQLQREGAGLVVGEALNETVIYPEKLRGMAISGRSNEAIRRAAAKFLPSANWPVEWYRYVVEPSLERINICSMG